MSNDEIDKLENHKIMKKYINYYKKSKEITRLYTKSLVEFAASLIIAPFYTVAISRQLSITAHKNIYGDYQPENKNSKDLIKLQNEVTLRDARNYELIKQSKVLDGQRPYRAPIYDNYFQTIKGLYRQGILGFYKGNFFRLIATSTSQRLNINLHWYIKENYPKLLSIGFIAEWLCLSVCDMITHLMFVCENRFILQSRLPHFFVYKNAKQVLTRSHTELLRGIPSHIAKNFLYLLGFYLNFIFYKQDYKYSVVAGTVFYYPYLTAFRRVVCESRSIAGMLPLRYLNTIHALFLIRKEEGIFRGLYKGFLSYLIGTVLWVSFVPGIANMIHLEKSIVKDKELFGDDPVFKEINKRKLAELKSQ